MGNFQVVKEEQTHMVGKFMLSNPETMGHEGKNLLNKLGVFLTNARV